MRKGSAPARYGPSCTRDNTSHIRNVFITEDLNCLDWKTHHAKNFSIKAVQISKGKIEFRDHTAYSLLVCAIPFNWYPCELMVLMNEIPYLNDIRERVSELARA